LLQLVGLILVVLVLQSVKKFVQMRVLWDTVETLPHIPKHRIDGRLTTLPHSLAV